MSIIQINLLNKLPHLCGKRETLRSRVWPCGLGTWGLAVSWGEAPGCGLPRAPPPLPPPALVYTGDAYGPCYENLFSLVNQFKRVLCFVYSFYCIYSHLWTTTRSGKIYGGARVAGIPRRGAAGSLRLRRGDLHRQVDGAEPGRHAGAHSRHATHGAHAATSLVVVHWSGGHGQFRSFRRR